MSRALELAAIQAIFHRQYNTDRAVRFVTQEAGVSPEVAKGALQQVMTAYR
jgi:hypothetical protein